MYKLLVVDDDPVTNATFSRQLMQRHCTVFRALHAEEALEILSREKDSLHGIFLDLAMPGMDGFEVMRIVRMTYDRIQLPIVVVSAKEAPKDALRALGLGANDFMTKPIHIGLALARMRTHIMLKQLREEAIKKKQTEAINALIVTYNHEINNPLAIASGILQLMTRESANPKLRDAVDALERIADIVRKITAVGEQGNIDLEPYADSEHMLSLKDAS